jgi:hypothetical protein
MSIFGTDHLGELRPQDITAGPSVPFGDAVSQGFEQQFRVDSPLAFEVEITNRWLENIERLRKSTGEEFNSPAFHPVIRDFAMMQAGMAPKGPDEANRKFYEEQMELLQRADTRIKELADPELQSFGDIVREVVAMQQGVEAATNDQADRGGFGTDVGQFIGAIGGAFTTRDPVSLFSLPIGGGGRTVAMKIATEMGIGAAAATAVSPQVQANREVAGLPQRSVLADIAVGAVGAGVVRGIAEGVGAGLGRLGRAADEPIMDLADDELATAFADNPQSPRARAGEAILNDVQAIERANPYGVGDAANARFMAELQQVAAAVSGTPSTAIARVLPPVPFDSIKKAADFEIVREQAPQVYAKLEAAQAAVREIEERLSRAGRNSVDAYHGGPREIQDFRLGLGRDGRPASDSRNVISFATERRFAEDYAGARGAVTSARVDVSDFADFRNSEDVAKAREYHNRLSDEWAEGVKKTHGHIWTDELLAEKRLKDAAGIEEGNWQKWENPKLLEFMGKKGAIVREVNASGTESLNVIVADLTAINAIPKLRTERRLANKRYQAAYKAVEAEAATIERFQAAVKARQQGNAVDLLGNEIGGLPFVGPILRYDAVEARVTEINRVNEVLADPETVRMTLDEETGMVDIGGRLVPADFVVPFDDGDLSIRAIIDDFAEDSKLEEAVRSCAL